MILRELFIFVAAFAMFAFAAPAHAGEWDDAKSVALNLIEAIETNKAVSELGLEPALNSAQADFLDGFQKCRVSKTFEKFGKRNFQKNGEILLWYSCPEAISVGETISANSWHVSLKFDQGKLIKIHIYDVEIKPRGWKPE